jgi:hypothetical protein
MEALPAEVRRALKDLYAEVDELHRAQAAAITDQAFERAAELRDWSESLKRKLATISREAGLREGDIPPYPG